MSVPTVSFEHILRLSDDTGLAEHALGAIPRRECGYCVDDVARGLLAVSREPEPTADLVVLADRYLAFLAHAQDPAGGVRNRLGYDRRWSDEPATGDWWGRSLWAWGAVVSGDGPAWQRADALHRFSVSGRLRSPWTRATAFAALGAAEVLDVHPDHAGARALLVDARAQLVDARRSPPDPVGGDWRWPEVRLTYANAALPEALIAAGAALDDDRTVLAGLDQLAWLVDRQTSGDHLSVVPAGGRGPGETGPGFDQQPIEVAALADAAARALAVTGDERWRVVLARSVGWFLGANDVGAAMFDPATGGGFDGLEAGGPNRNQGAESTLAWLLTLQHGRRLAGEPAPGGASPVSPGAASLVLSTAASPKAPSRR